MYSQKAEKSCGIACIIMVNFKMKKWQMATAVAAVPVGGIPALPVAGSAIQGAVKSEEQVDAAYAKVTGRPYRGTTDTDATILPKVLNQLEIGKWVGRYVPAKQVADTIIARPFSDTPCIALVHWRAGGGHFVVCDNVVKNGASISADFCDPWDGAVRTVPLHRGQSVVYQVKDQPDGLDFGQPHKKYGSSSTADMDGWLVYRNG